LHRPFLLARGRHVAVKARQLAVLEEHRKAPLLARLAAEERGIASQE